MARKKGPPSARAQERAALQARFGGATLIGLREGTILSAEAKGPQALKDLYRDLRKYYTDARSKAVKQVARTMKSDVPFIDNVPSFPKTSELSNEEIARAIADVNRYLNSPTYGLQERREAYEELLEDLHEKGLDFLNMKNLGMWERFRKWLRASKLLGLPYTDGSVIMDIFKTSVEEGRADSERWKELYEEYRELLPKPERKPRRRNRSK